MDVYADLLQNLAETGSTRFQIHILGKRTKQQPRRQLGARARMLKNNKRNLEMRSTLLYPRTQKKRAPRRVFGRLQPFSSHIPENLEGQANPKMQSRERLERGGT